MCLIYIFVLKNQPQPSKSTPYLLFNIYLSKIQSFSSEFSTHLQEIWKKRAFFKKVAICIFFKKTKNGSPVQTFRDVTMFLKITSWCLVPLQWDRACLCIPFLWLSSQMGPWNRSSRMEETGHQCGYELLIWSVVPLGSVCWHDRVGWWCWYVQQTFSQLFDAFLPGTASDQFSNIPRCTECPWFGN